MARNRKKKSKSFKVVLKLLILFIILSIIAYIGYMKYNELNNVDNEIDNDITLDNDSDNDNIEEDVNDNIEEEIPTLSTNEYNEELDMWYLTLVNRDSPMPDDYEMELSSIDATRQFDSRAIDELIDMMTAAKADGVDVIWAQSTYRSVERQQELVDNSVASYMSYGYTEEEALEKTYNEINPAGTSEHNLGLAVDFNTITDDFEDTEAFAWLQENAEDYGFVLRYPEDKVDITMVKYESWHYRYVTVEHAKAMNDLDMCLEEYIDYLKGNV